MPVTIMLTFDSADDSWSMKYNLVWDRLLDFNLFPTEVAERELEYYQHQQNRYGLPLDSRDTYTKSDWLVWCAAMSSTQAGFETMIAPLWDFMNETSARVPVTDWYDTISGKQMNFQNRSVVGDSSFDYSFHSPDQIRTKTGDVCAQPSC